MQRSTNMKESIRKRIRERLLKREAHNRKRTASKIKQIAWNFENEKKKMNARRVFGLFKEYPNEANARGE